MAVSSPIWPPPAGLTTQNVPFKDTILCTNASTRINAPAPVVFETLLHVTNYGQWNTFCPKVTVQVQPRHEDVDKYPPQFERLERGTIFTFHVIMDSTKPDKETPTQLKVTDISTPEAPSDYIPAATLVSEESYTADLSKLYRVSWKIEGGFVTRGLKTERFHEVIVLGEKECEVRTWENQGGMLAHTVKWMYKQTLKEKFALWCADLKKFCEEKVPAPEG